MHTVHVLLGLGYFTQDGILEIHPWVLLATYFVPFILFLKDFLCFYVYGCCLHICTTCMKGTLEYRRGHSPLELSLQMNVSHHVDAGN